MFRTAIATLSFAVLVPASVWAQDVAGTWRTEPTGQGYLEIAIRPCGPALCGTILRARDLQGQPQPYAHVGRQMIWDMRPDGPGAWSDGRIWDPRNDRTFRSRMTLRGDRLEVSGCVMGICQTQNWQRVN